MLEQELQKAEYDALNKEILENSTKIYLVLNFCITAAGAFLVLGLNLDPNRVPFGRRFLPFASLLPFSVILPSIILVESSFNSTVRIASFLRLEYESKGVIRWQTVVQRYRSLPGRRRFMWGVGSVFYVLATICLASSITSLAWIIQCSPIGGLYITGYVIGTAVLAAVFLMFMLRLTQTWSHDNFSEMEDQLGKVLNSATRLSSKPADLV